jgi:hypothetical protein
LTYLEECEENNNVHQENLQREKMENFKIFRETIGKLINYREF